MLAMFKFTWEGLYRIEKRIIIIHLLGLAPAGYLAAPDSGPRACFGVVHAKHPYRETVVSLCH
jgi:hypothetical protein